MIMLEQAITSTQFAWGAMLLAETLYQSRLVALVANQVFCCGSLLCCLFLERVPSLWP